VRVLAKQDPEAVMDRSETTPFIVSRLSRGKRRPSYSWALLSAD
jgi:hypothetical protein